MAIKILFLSSRKVDPSSGAAKRAQAILVVLRKLGNVEVAYVSKRENRTFVETDATAIRKRNNKSHYWIPLTFQLVKVAFPFLYARFKYRGAILRDQSGYPVNGRAKYDMVWYFKLQSWMLLHNKMNASKFILDLDDLDFEKTLGRALITSNVFDKALQRVTAYFERRLVIEAAKKCNWVFVCSNLQVRSLGAKNCSSLRNIVESDVKSYDLIDRFRKNNHPRAKCILHVGNYTNDANVDGVEWFCKEIFPLILEEEETVELRIYGKSSFVVKHLASSKVKVCGEFESFDDLIKDVNAVSISPTRFGSGTRVKVVESLSYGVPVVSTSKGAEGIDVINGQEILLCDDPESFKDGCISLFRNPELYQKLSLSGLQAAQLKYSQKSIEEEMFTIIGKQLLWERN